MSEETQTVQQPKKAENVMRTIKIDKVTLNIGAGAEAKNVDKAVSLLKTISGKKVVKTKSKKRIAQWKIRLGLPIGAMVTLRGKDAEELLKKLLESISYELKESNFTQNGFSFGIKEYIDIPGVKYDPQVGIIGFNVSVTLKRAGFNITLKKIKPGKIAPGHKITPKDSMKFAKENLAIKVKEKSK